MTTPMPDKKKKARSPSYPGINLETALRRARQMYEKENRQFASVSTILEDWGYQPKSGGGLVVLAALLKFGLLVDEGSGDTRRARLSDEALRILLDEREESEERLALVKEAAMKPPIHEELWTRYQGALPSDANLRHFLIFEKGFTETAAKEFIQEFRETVAFAELDASAILSPSKGDSGLQARAGYVPPAPSNAPPAPMMTMTTIQLPIAGPRDQWPALVLPKRLDEASWNQMLAVLTAMKVGIVAEEDAEPEAE